MPQGIIFELKALSFIITFFNCVSHLSADGIIKPQEKTKDRKELEVYTNGYEQGVHNLNLVEVCILART